MRRKFGTKASSAAALVVVLGLALSSSASAVVLSPLWWRPAARIDPAAHPDLQSVPRVACPSVSLCVAIDGAGNVVTSTNPAGGAGTWSVAHVDNSPLEALSCPASSLCVALDQAGNVLAASDPAGGPSAWTLSPVPEPNPPGGGTYGLSCPSVSLCVGWEAGGNGNAIISTDPADGTSAWHVVRVDSSAVSCGYHGEDSCSSSLVDVSCASPALCVGVDDNGYATVSANPTGGAAMWSSSAVDAPSSYGDYDPFQVVSCAAAGLCVAGDFVGNVAATTNLVAGRSAWTVIPVEPPSYGGGISGLSCPSISLCVGVTERVFASRNPAGGAGAWKNFDIGASSGGFGLHVTCPSASLCVVVDGAGNAFSSTNPAGGPRSWIPAHVDGTGVSNNMTGLSCASTSLCVAVDLSGNAVVGSATPTQAQVKTLLRRQLAPRGKAARIAAVVQNGGYSFSFTAPTTGRLAISWYLVQRGGHVTGSKPKPVLVATAAKRFVTARTLKIRIKLTKQGTLLLRGVPHASLTAKGNFTPKGGTSKVTATRPFTLKQ